MSSDSPKTLSDLRYPIACIVTVIWVLAFILGALTQNLLLLGATTPVFTIVVMAVLTVKNGNGRNGRNNGKEQG